jgi:hypothetical protein
MCRSTSYLLYCTEMEDGTTIDGTTIDGSTIDETLLT